MMLGGSGRIDRNFWICQAEKLNRMGTSRRSTAEDED
jgi:hypothetical protein